MDKYPGCYEKMSNRWWWCDYNNEEVSRLCWSTTRVDMEELILRQNEAEESSAHAKGPTGGWTRCSIHQYHAGWGIWRGWIPLGPKSRLIIIA